MLTVARDEDFSFLPMDDRGRVLDYSRFDIGGEPEPDRDRRARRPSCSPIAACTARATRIELGMIVRAADWKRPLTGLPLELVLTDPRGTVAQRERLALGESGFESSATRRATARRAAPGGASLFLIGTQRLAHG